MATDDQARLIEQLRVAGATDDEIDAAAATGALGPLAIEIALRPPGAVMPYDDAVARTGVDGARAAAAWQTLGLPDPRRSSAMFTAPEAEVLAAVVRFAGVLGDEGMTKISRVLGAAAARVAEAVVEAMRVGFELPELGRGTSYPDVVEQYSTLTSVAYPRLVEIFDFVLRRQISTFARGAWIPSEDQRAMSVERLVGFVDLVGYTALAATLGHGELPELISRFEAAVSRSVAAAGGRVVKTIGDEIMFVVPDAVEGCRVATSILTELRDERLPDARVGIAYGPMVGYEGDYFGDVVNIAARLVALAGPMTVLATAELRDAATALGLSLTSATKVALKGFAEPVDVVSITGS